MDCLDQRELHRGALAGAHAAFNLGALYENKLNDMEKAVGWYRKAAEAGFPNAVAWLKEHGY